MSKRIEGRSCSFGSTAQGALWARIVALSVLPLIRTVNEVMNPPRSEAAISGPPSSNAEEESHHE